MTNLINMRLQDSAEPGQSSQEPMRLHDSQGYCPLTYREKMCFSYLSQLGNFSLGVLYRKVSGDAR